MSNQDPSWYLTTSRMKAKKGELEHKALESLRHGDPQKALEYADEADSLNFSRRKTDSNGSSQPQPQPQPQPKIGGVVPVRIVRRKKHHDQESSKHGQKSSKHGQKSSKHGH